MEAWLWGNAGTKQAYILSAKSLKRHASVCTKYDCDTSLEYSYRFGNIFMAYTRNNYAISLGQVFF